MGIFYTSDVGQVMKNQPTSKLESCKEFSTSILRLISTVYDIRRYDASKGISHDEKSSIDKKPEASFSGTNKGQKQKQIPLQRRQNLEEITLANNNHCCIKTLG